MSAVVNLNRGPVLRAVLPETLPLAKAMREADPEKVNGSNNTLRKMASGPMPELVRYSLNLSEFGQLLITSCPRRVCHVAFTETNYSPLEELRETFPCAQLQHGNDPLHLRVLAFIEGAHDGGEKIVLNMRGTAFQHRVWAALLQLPRGTLVTYGQIAQFIGQPQSARAVGTAIGANKTALLVPCHCGVVRSGEIGGFMWGIERKKVIISAEIEGLQA